MLTNARKDHSIPLKFPKFHRNKTAVYERHTNPLNVQYRFPLFLWKFQVLKLEGSKKQINVFSLGPHNFKNLPKFARDKLTRN